jgi:putative transposase
MRQARHANPPRHTGQTWETFLANHAPHVWASDFLQTYDAFFRVIFLFFIIEHGSRRVVHIAVTRAPSDARVAQQICEATPFGAGPRFLLCDNDDKYWLIFERAVVANSICERFLGSIRRECLDHMLIFNKQHTRRVVSEYVDFFNHARPHQGIHQQIPDPAAIIPLAEAEQHHVIGLPILHGLQHDYRWVA